jgi:hypothetical protein
MKAHTMLTLRCQVDFIQPDGATITNTISDGPGMADSDLNMTYSFEWRTELQEGSNEHQEKVKGFREGAKTAVHSSIEAMRKMAAAGELD